MCADVGSGVDVEVVGVVVCGDNVCVGAGADAVVDVDVVGVVV